MTKHDHFAAIDAGDIRPRVVEHNGCTSEARYVAWTPTWECQARYDYVAALADLNDKLRRE